MLEKIVKFPKITQQVEDTQYRQSAVGENLKTVSSASSEHTCPANRESSGGEAAKIFKMTTQRKHSPRQERSQVNKQVKDAVKVKKDHQHESAVKENPTIQEKSQPRSKHK